jgi:ribosomal protein S18 acetylase RimI-like enzyme
LLHHVIHAATQHGEPSIWLNVLKSNEAGRRFYARHGFDIVGELPYRTDLGDDAGMWTMARTLA